MMMAANMGRDPGHPPDSAPDEAALVARVRCGDALACEELVSRNAGAMLAVARRFLGCEQDAADAVQEAFLAAFRSIHEFAGASKLSTWLHRIIVNACLMKLRSAKARRSRSIESLLPGFDDTGHHVRRIRAWSESPLEQLHEAELRE
ncbi:MAG: sigma-70 family RNA polymerase sigma factor, partial [Planctomycetes bacterium]|nr:sigma-70 family RNA polymerase sigma factor [Planctomycetota bacterium]